MTHSAPHHPFLIDNDESTEEEMIHDQPSSPSKPKLQRSNATLNEYTCHELPISVIHLHEQRLHQISQELKSHPNMYENWNLFLYHPNTWQEIVKSWPRLLRQEVHSIFKIWRQNWREQDFECAFLEPFPEDEL